ncbi:MAG: sensor histidine kinase [Ktedonobacteraceae bacterium]
MTRNNVDSLKLHAFPLMRYIVSLLSICVILGLFLWSFLNYQPNPTFYGPRAIYSMLILSIALALLGRIILIRMLKFETAKTDIHPYQLRSTWRLLFLIDIAAPLYLAAGVLIGPPAAVLLASITQMALQGFTLFWRFISWSEAVFSIASISLIAFISAFVYRIIGGSPKTHFIDNFQPIAESKEFLGSILSATVMLLLFIVFSLLFIMQMNRTGLRAAWREYMQSSILRFQALVLSVGPLLPVVDIFDDRAAELAWLFFLVPLFAIYYLALISTRLSIRTDELQLTFQDLNSARRREDELRDYASLITRVQEEERKRLARELHDDTAQALIALSLGLDGLGRAIGKLDLSERDAQWLSNLQDLADRTLEGVRRACRDLRPSVLDDLGLRAALEWLSDSSSTRGIPCTFTCIGLPQPTTPESEIAIFRIVQESLSNIWRHSFATQAGIDLSYVPRQLHLKVWDNGEGFSTVEYLDLHHNSQSGLGLVGMRERAILIGANLKIISKPGEGCSVELSLPLP